VPSVTTVSLDREVAKGGVASWILAYAYSHNTLGVVSAALIAISWRPRGCHRKSNPLCRSLELAHYQLLMRPKHNASRTLII
jgi:hypothetical protein